MLLIILAALKLASSDYINSAIQFFPVFFTQPSNTYTPFSLNLQLYNSDNSQAQIFGIPITISLSPYSPLNGTLTVTTNNQGLAIFTNIFSVYTGTFNILATANNYFSFWSNIFTIDSGNIPFYNLTITPYERNIYSHLFINYFKVAAYDSNLSLMQLPCKFSFFVNQIELDSSVAYGHNDFNFYYTTTSTKSDASNITATCNSLNQTISQVFYPVMYKTIDCPLVLII